MNGFKCFIVCFEVKMFLRNLFWIIQGRYSLISFVSFFAGSAFTQQELPACKPLLTPGWVCVWPPHKLFEYWFYSSKQPYMTKDFLLCLISGYHDFHGDWSYLYTYRSYIITCFMECKHIYLTNLSHKTCLCIKMVPNFTLDELNALKF